MNLSQCRRITDQELVEMVRGMDQAEQAGIFDELFSREQPIRNVSASKEQLLQSIGPKMKLTKGFFRKIYGYEISYPGFEETAIRTLEEAGCMKARGYYDEIIGEYQRQQDEEIRPVAAEYAKECNRKWEQNEGEGERKRQKNSSRQERWKNFGELLNFQ